MALFSKKAQAAPIAAKPAPVSAPSAGETAGATAAAQTAVSHQQAMLALGEIVSLLMRSQHFQSAPLSAIAALTAPALKSGQYVVARAQSKEGAMSPVGACLWATVSPGVDARLSRDLDTPIYLAPAEWSGGDIPWIVLYVGDRRVILPMLRRLQAETLKGRPLKIRMREGDAGPVKVRVLSAESPLPEGKGKPN